MLSTSKHCMNKNVTASDESHTTWQLSSLGGEEVSDFATPFLNLHSIAEEPKTKEDKRLLEAMRVEPRAVFA